MSTIPKPRSETVRPEITRLPELTFWRRGFRNFVRIVLRFFTWMCLNINISGLENMPDEGPLVIVSNHLGDADVFVGIAYTKASVDIMSKAELYDLPILGKLMHAYGVIWVHRGQPDRRALRAALDGLKDGRILALAPEGRESMTGELEEGTGGAAYLAQKSKAPILPVTFTGTENKFVFSSLKRFKRAHITLTIGHVFHLDEYPDRKTEIEQGTLKIMRTLARQLPSTYRGVYRQDISAGSESEK